MENVNGGPMHPTPLLPSGANMPTTAACIGLNPTRSTSVCTCVSSCVMVAPLGTNAHDSAQPTGFRIHSTGLNTPHPLGKQSELSVDAGLGATPVVGLPPLPGTVPV